MNNLLLTQDSTGMTDKARDRIIDRKTLYTRVISFFDVEQAKKNLEEQIANN